MQKYIWIVFVIAAVGYFLTYVLAGHYVKGLKDPYEEDLEEDLPPEPDGDSSGENQ